jgi:hypothetical protein
MTLDAAETVLGFFGFDRVLTAISKGNMAEGNGCGMKN